MTSTPPADPRKKEAYMKKKTPSRLSPRTIREGDVEAWYYTNGRSIDLLVRRPHVEATHSVRLYESDLRRMLADISPKRKSHVR